MTSLGEIYPQAVAVCWRGTPGCDSQEILDIRFEKLLPRIRQILAGKAHVLRQKLIPQKPRNNKRFEYRLAFQPNGRIPSEEVQVELGSKILDEFQMLFDNACGISLNEF
ncbi:MAG TPA: hypothetical protein VMV10_18985 [Pirellulales bacterium]|nr:hypothetical protein [Pirellulales bacterium]